MEAAAGLLNVKAGSPGLKPLVVKKENARPTGAKELGVGNPHEEHAHQPDKRY